MRLLTAAALSAAVCGGVLTPDCQLGTGLVLQSVLPATTTTDGKVTATLRALCGGNPTRLNSAGAINGRCGDAGYQLQDGGLPVSADEARWCLSPVVDSGSTTGTTTGTTGGTTTGASAPASGIIVLVLLDTSNSVANTAGVLTELKTAVTSFTQTVLSSAPTAELSLHAFDGRSGTQRITDWSSDATVHNAAVQALVCGGTSPFCRDPRSTNLYGALDEAARLLTQAAETRSLAAAYLVFFTDGTDQAQRLTRDQSVASLSGVANLEVYAVGIEGETRTGSTGVDMTELQTLTFGRADRVFTTQSAGDLSVPFAAAAQRVAQSVGAAAAVGGGLYSIEYCTPRRSGDAHPMRLRWQGQDLGWETQYTTVGIDSELARACEATVCVCTPAPPMPPPPPPPPSPPPPPLVCAPIGCRSPAEVDVLLQSRPCTTVSAHAFRRAVTLDADYAVVAGRETAFLAECTAAVAVPGVVCADVFQGSVVVALGSNSSTQLGTAASQIQRQGVSTTFGTMRATPATTPAPQRDCDDSAVWSWRYVSIALGVVVLVLAAVICALLVMRARSDKGGRKRRGDDKEGEMSRQAPSAATDQAKSVVYAPSPGSWPPPTSRPRQWQSVKSPISDRAPDLGQLVHLGPAWEVRRHVETCPALHDVQWTDVYEDHCNRTGTVVEVDTDGTAKVQFPDGAEVWYPFQCVVAAEQQPWHGEQPPHALTRHG